MGRPDSPLHVRPYRDAGLLPWLARFWRSSTVSRFERGYAAIADLNRDTFDLFDELRQAGVDTSLTRPGMVHAFLSVAHARQHLRVQRLMADGRYEVPADVAVGEAAHELDASIAPSVRAAYLVPGEGVVDPGRFARSLRDRIQDAGGKVHENVEVSGFQRSGDTVVGLRTSQGDMACGAVVVAAGMWSAKLLRGLDYRLSLQTGKGYSFSIELDPAPSHTLYFGMLGVTLGPASGQAVTEYVLSGRRPSRLVPFRFDR